MGREFRDGWRSKVFPGFLFRGVRVNPLSRLSYFFLAIIGEIVRIFPKEIEVKTRLNQEIKLRRGKYLPSIRQKIKVKEKYHQVKLLFHTYHTLKSVLKLRSLLNSESSIVL